MSLLSCILFVFFSVCKIKLAGLAIVVLVSPLSMNFPGVFFAVEMLWKASLLLIGNFAALKLLSYDFLAYSLLLTVRV